MSPAATKVWNLIDGRLKGATRDVTVPGFVLKHIDEVTEASASEALRLYPGDSHASRCERLAFYLDEFLSGIADNMRGHATKEFCQVMACYIRNDLQSYTIDSSGCVNPVAA
jgi:hypothetical protein